ncbi:tRNA dihydrouridine synthase DusB [Bacteroidota bacterium]
MKVGSIYFGRKLILAPMADITDSSFRKIAKEFGAGLTFTQMVSAKGVTRNQFDTLKLLSFHRSEKPVGVQILGKNPDHIRNAVNEIKSFNPDIFDLNCGCSVEKITKHGFGSVILEDPVLLGNLVKTMVEAADDIPVSIKIRLGKNHSKINVIDNAKIIEDNGASVVTVHGRTRSDKYDVEADWEWIAKVKEAVTIPVVGNGSCFTPQDVQKLIETTNCDTVMVARGALGNPFIFSRFNAIIENGNDPGEPEPALVRDTALKHLKYLIENFGEDVGLGKAKKHTIWYFMNFKGITSFVDEVLASREVDQFKELISNHTSKIEDEFYPEEDFEIINKNFKIKALFWLNDKLKNEFNETGNVLI